MVDLRKYSKRLQDRLGDTKSADEIVENAWWDVVVRELNQMSVSCAKELQQETGLTYSKPAREKVQAYTLDFEQAPPTRLLALGLILNHWLGWINREKGHNSPPLDASNRLRAALTEGQTLSEQKQVP